MKKTLSLAAAILALSLSACSSIPDKPVTEPLETEELSKAMKSDSLFAEVYEYARFCTALMSETEKARYSEISYRRALDYARYIEDGEHWDKQRAKYEKEWEKQNDELGAEVDKEIERVRKSIDESGIYDKVSIELKDIKDKPVYFLFSSFSSTIGFSFEVVPLAGTINELDFAYGFVNPYNKKNEFEFLASKRITKREIADTAIIAGRDVSLETGTAPTKEELLKEMGFMVIPLEVVMGSDTVSIHARDIADNVLKCICINKAKFPKAYEHSRDLAMRELFPDKVMGRNKYVKEKEKEEKKQKDELCYEFFIIDLE